MCPRCVEEAAGLKMERYREGRWQVMMTSRCVVGVGVGVVGGSGGGGGGRVMRIAEESFCVWC